MNAVILALSLLMAQAQPRPSIVWTPECGYVASVEALRALDAELKRLQAIEATHKGESWTTTVLVSAAVGLAVGALAVGSVVFVAGRKAP